MLYRSLIDYFEVQSTVDFIEDITTNLYVGNLQKYTSYPILYIFGFHCGYFHRNMGMVACHYLNRSNYFLDGLNFKLGFFSNREILFSLLTIKRYVQSSSSSKPIEQYLLYASIFLNFYLHSL